MPVIGSLFGRERHLSGSLAGPLWVGEVELGRALSLEPVLAPPSPSHRRALLLVRLHTLPVGTCTVPLGPDGKADLSDLARKIADECRSAILAHLREDAEAPEGADDPIVPLRASLEAAQPDALAGQLRRGLGEWCPAREHLSAPPISVALCASERPPGPLLASLARLEYPEFEVLVIDPTAPDESGAQQLLAEAGLGGDARFRAVAAPELSPMAVRERAVVEARYDLVAFVGEAGRADAHWLEGIARGFARAEQTAGVLGLLGEVEAESTAEAASPGPQWWSSLEPAWLHGLAGEVAPLALGERRDGQRAANFALDRRLVASTPSERDLLARVLQAGALCFEPSAILWRSPRSHDASAGLRHGRGSHGPFGRLGDLGLWREGLAQLSTALPPARGGRRTRDLKRPADGETVRRERRGDGVSPAPRSSAGTVAPGGAERSEGE